MIVSVTAIAGTAAPVRPAASIAREITADVTKGRAASWIRTMSGFALGQRLEAGMHRGLARRAAIGGRLMAQAGDGLVEHGGIVGVHHRLHGEHVRMPAERLHGAEDHGLAADRAVLLGPAGAGAKAAPGCDEDGGCALGIWALDSSCGRIGLRGEC